jgi:hypothetical protein
MANGAQQSAARKGLLVDRLQKQIDRLQAVHAKLQNEELQKAIQELKEDLTDLKACASHVFGPPPPRR